MYKDKNRLKVFVVKFLKVILIIAAIFYVFLHLLSTVAFDYAVEFVSNTFNIDKSLFLAEETSEQADDFIARLIDTEFFAIFTVMSFVFSTVGTFILTRRKSIFSAIGLFVAFVLPKEEIYWGTIKDKSSNSIIPFAIIRVVRQMASGAYEFVKQTVADVDGKYSLFLHSIEPAYKLEIAAPGYSASVIDISGPEKSAGIFDITQDIYLDREPKGEMRNKLSYLSPKIYGTLMWFIYVNSFLFVFIFLYYIYAWPDGWYGYFASGIFLYSFVRNSFTIRQRFFRPKGRVIEKETKLPVEGVTVSVFKEGNQLETQSTDPKGLVKFGLKSGVYDIRVEKAGFRLIHEEATSGTKSFAGRIKIRSDGYLDNSIYLLKSGERVDIENVRANPFA